MKREKVDNGKETGMIHSWRCCQRKSYIIAHGVFIFSAIKYMFFMNFKRSLWKTPCCPLQTQSAKSFCNQPFFSCPLTFRLEFSSLLEYIGTCFVSVSRMVHTTFKFQERGFGTLYLWTPLASAFSSSSLRTVGDFPTTKIRKISARSNSLLICLHDCLQLHPSPPFIVLRAHWTHSLRGRIQPSHATYILTPPVWTKIYHFNGSYWLCLWVIRCLLREKVPLQRSQTECANQSPVSCKPW